MMMKQFRVVELLGDRFLLGSEGTVWFTIRLLDSGADIRFNLQWSSESV